MLIGFKEVESKDGNYFQRGELKLKFNREDLSDLDPTVIKAAYFESLSHYILPNYSLEQLEQEIEEKINGHKDSFLSRLKSVLFKNFIF